MPESLSKFTNACWSTLVICALTIVFFVRAANALQFDEVGYAALVNELGTAIPTGTGIKVSQIEATNDNDHYGPIMENLEFEGITFDFLSGSPGTSGHSTNVGERLYGNSTSMAPGIDMVDLYESDNWLNSGFLRTRQSLEPKVENSRIQNHSWIGSLGTSSKDIDALRRLDYVVNRDDVFVAVGTDIGSNEPLPVLLAQFHNGLVVGTQSGDHASGLTTRAGAGRIKPDIVGPNEFPSFSAPMVGASAALLIEAAENTAGLSEAVHNEALRAIILAGATKDEFPQWERTTTRPLDDHYGAGELNIYRSYHILTDGQQSAGAVSLVQPQGWDFSTSTSNNVYFFEVPAGMAISELSAVLVWNREITDGLGSGFNPSVTGINNLDLKLHNADNLTLGSVLDTSESTIDNIEHIYLNESRGMGEFLFAGQYALEVVSPSSGVDYSLAWFSINQPVHQWTSIAADSDWKNAANWESPGLPDSDWVANVDNVSVVGGKTATIREDTTVHKVFVSGSGGPMTVAVENGSTLTATSGIEINSGGAISGGGTIDGTLVNSGSIAIGTAETLTVVGDVELDDVVLMVTDDYTQIRATETGMFSLLSATNVTGTVSTPAGIGIASHLGRGHFLKTLDLSATQVDIDIFAALGGDTNGDHAVDITDFNSVALNFDGFGMNSENGWTLGDFDDDGDIDITDFNTLAVNFGKTDYTPMNHDRAMVPEPSGFLLIVGAGLLGWSTVLRFRRKKMFIEPVKVDARMSTSQPTAS